MSKIYTFYCILSSDTGKHNLIISSNKEEIQFPVVRIECPKFLHNEIRYNLQQMLLKDSYEPEIIKQINFSYIDIQNEFILKLVEEKYNNVFDIDNDIFILCSIILSSPVPLNKHTWKEFEFIKSYENTDLTTSIIDFAVQKSIL